MRPGNDVDADQLDNEYGDGEECVDAELADLTAVAWSIRQLSAMGLPSLEGPAGDSGHNKAN